ncbi:MAG: DJ-1/PfpI family protein [Clostridiales bacterium]|nr:DJ-1/PfpI family protein [Candidatus Blautia equi]
MSTVYVFLADGFEDIEGLAVVDLLRRAKVETRTVSIKDTKEVQTSHGITLYTDLLFCETDFSDAAILVLPGGLKGTQNLQAYEPLTTMLQEFYGAEKKIAAICAAPSIFGALGFLKGRNATSYPSFMEKLDGAILSTERVVKDGHVITSRGMGTAIDFGLALIAELCGQEKADEIAAQIVYNH